VIVAAAELPPATDPIDSVFAGPVGPTLPVGPDDPCGPTPPAIVTDELELVTDADTVPPETVAVIGCDVTDAEMSLISPPPRSPCRSPSRDSARRHSQPIA
jgi:hypothetical protein